MATTVESTTGVLPHTHPRPITHLNHTTERMLELDDERLVGHLSGREDTWLRRWETLLRKRDFVVAYGWLREQRKQTTRQQPR